MTFKTELKRKRRKKTRRQQAQRVDGAARKAAIHKAACHEILKREVNQEVRRGLYLKGHSIPKIRKLMRIGEGGKPTPQRWGARCR